MTKHHRRNTGPGNTSDHVRRQANWITAWTRGTTHIGGLTLRTAASRAQARSSRIDHPRGPSRGDAETEGTTRARTLSPRAKRFSSAARPADIAMAMFD